MRVVLFCGGLGTRLREYSDTIPKPLVPIGTRPIVWHLMRYYAHFGHTRFVLCLGYKGTMLKEYFTGYQEWLSNDFTLRRGGRDLELHARDIDDWEITFVDTGAKANIGERLAAVRDHLGDDEWFLANYSDGLSDVDLNRYIDNVRSRDVSAGMLAVRTWQSFHAVKTEDDGLVRSLGSFSDEEFWVNAGFFVFHRSVFDYMRPGEELVEEPFQRLIRDGRLYAERFTGWWRAMDTFKDKIAMDEVYADGRGPWEVWKAGQHAP